MSQSQVPVFQSTQMQGKSTSEVFWLRIMNDIIRPRFLKVKQKQQNQCMQLDTVEKFQECYQYQADCLEKDTIEMEFFSRKFDKCVQEGRRALYPLKRVEEICSNKIINAIKEQTSIRRAREKQTRQQVQQANAAKAIQQMSITNPQNQQQSSTPSKAIQGPTVQVRSDGKYVNGHRLTWQEQKSLEKSDLIK